MTGATGSVPSTPPTSQDIEALPEILTAAEAAWLLRLSPGQLDGARKRGDITGTKVGRGWRYSKAALIQVVQTPSP